MIADEGSRIRGFPSPANVMKDDAEIMKLKTKVLLTALLLAALALMAGCAPEVSPYEMNDADGFTVSVRYDANGGTFTTNTSVITDSYSLSGLPSSGGKAQLALLPPDAAARGNDAFRAVNSGYVLAGWYTRRTETADGFIYSGKWNFQEDILSLDANAAYSSAEPVLTLYAAWIPMFQIEFYDLATGEYLDSHSFDPLAAEPVLLPQWDMESGAIEMHHFPKRSGFTFDGAFYDAQGKKQATGETVEHPGVIDYENGVAKDPVMKLYVNWAEGEWYHIYNVEQFLDNASVSGSYVLHADLDFTDEIWPSSLMYGNYTGTIEGNGHIMKNITLEQTNNSKVNAGLFGNLTESASVRDVVFENVSFTVKAGTRVAGTSYGLLAGTVSADAQVSGVSVKNSKLLIDSGCYFGADDYVIGLVCGMGEADVDPSGITCEATGTDPKNVKITVNGNEVEVEITTG